MKPFFQPPCIVAAAFAFLWITPAGLAAEGRAQLPLDGVWQFRLDPEAKGEGEHWEASGVRFDDAIRVPGAWDAQGFGSPTDKLHHNFIGKAWYKREVAFPNEWAGRRVFLCIGGVHRYADVWANGHYLGEHIGYLSPFEFDLTPHIRAGSQAVIAIRVDSKQRWDVDCLQGCFDIIDEMFTTWGGIWGHVRLEARQDAWLQDVHVQPRIEPAGCTVSAKIAGNASVCDRVLLAVAAADGKPRAEKSIPAREAIDANSNLHLDVLLPESQLWSPEKPELHTATLTLMAGDRTLDRIESRFGLREIRTDGCHFLLNGKRLFLRGYGDDAIYPETMAPPSDKQFYLDRLRTIKSYGFNFVRHHSHMLPPEYYDAADEVGMLVSAEFPIAYEEYFRRAKGPALELYQSEWAAAITRLRNHPSIFDWCMGNEEWNSLAIAPKLYAAAKALDPARLVIDSDGLFPAGFLVGKQDRPTLDFYAVQFDCSALPLDKPAKHAVPGTPAKPVICHETGNYVTFPRLAAVGNFTDNFKPFWLTPARDKLARLGLLDEAERWSRNSERLYLLCHKLNEEDLRKQPKVSGYQWWLFQDYWTGSNGLVDHYFHPKDIRPEEVRAFNNEVVLLLDGLDVTARSGQRIELSLLTSNYSPDALADAAVEWQANVDGQQALNWTGSSARLEQGEVSTIHKALVEVPAVTAPRKLQVTATLKAAGRSWSNQWSAWIYPADPEPPHLSVPLLAGGDVAEALARYRPQVVSGRTPLPERAVYVVSLPTRRILDATAGGGCVVMLDPAPLFPAIPNRFKTAWWLGNAADSNTGTVVYDHPVTRAIAPDGWCDAGWYHLLEGSQAAVLDDLPAAPEVLVRAIDVHSQCRSKAVLFQARIVKGSVIVSGLNFGLGDREKRPECEWLLDRLIEYAGTMPQAKAELPLEWLRARSDEEALPEGPVINGLARLSVNEGEQATYADYRGVSGPMYVCRQTAPGHRVEWETATVPADLKGETVVLRFAGGLGWRSQPETKGFVLQVDGRDAVSFDVTRDRRVWRGADAGISLLFVPRRADGEDAMGRFYLTIPVGMVKPGQSCRLAVISRGADSRRWFGLTP